MTTKLKLQKVIKEILDIKREGKKSNHEITGKCGIPLHVL